MRLFGRLTRFMKNYTVFHSVTAFPGRSLGGLTPDFLTLSALSYMAAVSFGQWRDRFGYFRAFHRARLRCFATTKWSLPHSNRIDY